MEWDIFAVEGMLSGLISRGLTIKLSLNQAGSAFCAVISEAGKPYGEGTALAAFHADMGRLLQMVSYMLEVKWPHFPEQSPTATQLELDW